MKSEIGIIGLATMGANLARNIAGRGIKTAVFNRSWVRTEELIEKHGSELKGNLSGHQKIDDLIDNLERPRKIILMVQAGAAVDQVIDELAPKLKIGDLIIDGGNSFYEDSERRSKKLQEMGINFMGMGISGGEEGALHGPSIMPGGELFSYQSIEKILVAISAKDFNGDNCVTYVGKGGAGHFVKMVHNGIEYAIMQLLSESYDLMRKLNQMGNPEIAAVYKKWNEGVLNCYLLDIVSQVIEKRDDLGEGFLIDKIKDQAGQKGTGGWTAIEGLKHGIALPQITAAVQARVISSQKKLRAKLNNEYNLENNSYLGEQPEIVRLENALYLGVILAYLEGFSLILAVDQEKQWGVSLEEVCRIWEGGCIIRSKLLAEFKQILRVNKETDNLLLTKEINKLIMENVGDLKEIVRVAIKFGIAIPCFSGAFNYLAGLTDEFLPANLIQGMRDFFGAHTYERLDRDGIFHTNWQE